MTLTNLEKTFKKVFLLILSLTWCVIALINIKGLNKYLQIISLTLKINDKWEFILTWSKISL